MASFLAKFKGPFTISRSIGANNFLIASQNSVKTLKVHADQLRLAVESPDFVTDNRDFMKEYGRHSGEPAGRGPKMRYNFRQRARN